MKKAKSQKKSRKHKRNQNLTKSRSVELGSQKPTAPSTWPSDINIMGTVSNRFA